TSNAKIYAAGDICSPYQFTHSADAMARIVIQNALFFGRKKTSDLVMPWATYTAPENAHVGMTAKEATEKGDEIVAYSAQMAEIDRAVLEGETAGFARIYADRRSGRILGATMMSAHAGESISEMALAITARLKMADVAATIHPYPTQAEIWKRLAGEYLKAKFTPSIARIFRVFLKLFAKT
ncbi:MAG: FAD-containing oxidoreductase, partial [Alphaproteobacteria bacterium]|nr:FAD-containing oxidoreductase [Alphaproteobacteria bacterium]